MPGVKTPRGAYVLRRLDAPELLADVANDVVYVNGVRQQAKATQAAA